MPPSSPVSLTLRVWREVSRHLDIAESIDAIAQLLAAQLPLARVLVHRFDRDPRQVRIVGESPSSDAAALGAHELSENDFRRLTRWVNKRETFHDSGQTAEGGTLRSLLAIPESDDDWYCAPLKGEHGSIGALSAFAARGKKFSPSGVATLHSVEEAFAAALDNDARLHELASLREAAEADRRSLLNRLGRKEVGDVIVGEESGLRHVIERVNMVSPSDVPVLILGETGAGKELVARAIHNRSNRHAGPFIRVNCGAIPRELIDSQLFGHERGAFTGASETRQGWFERADLGTLFLDEIGELPLDAQVRLLRVLQDGYIERVGGSKPIRVNVRVVAATHRDLAAMVRESAFREDLWYRIAVFPILLPPLRERVEDIPALANHFADRAAVRFGLATVLPTANDIALLQSYSWPGNIRELGAVIDRAAILGNGRRLELAAALAPIGQSIAEAPQLPTPTLLHPPARLSASAIPSLDSAMRQHIELALRATRGRIEGSTGAARLLRINPHTLRARMRKLKIDWRSFRQPSLDD